MRAPTVRRNTVLVPAVSVVALLLLAGCGTATGGDADPAAGGAPDPTPYDGPMVVQVDHGDRATVAERSGAAGLALECDGAPGSGGSGDYSDGLEEVQASPREAVADWLAAEAGTAPVDVDDLAVERTDEGDGTTTRVLLSYDVDGDTRIAFVVADGTTDYRDETGWGVDTWASCDRSELPEALAEADGTQVWTDRDGRAVPTTEVSSYRGPEHCDWQASTFLQLGGTFPDGQQYVGDPVPSLRRSLRTTYDPHAMLPDDATDTGYRRDGRALWTVPADDAAYLVAVDDRTDVERWPAAREPIGCM